MSMIAVWPSKCNPYGPQTVNIKDIEAIDSELEQTKLTEDWEQRLHTRLREHEERIEQLLQDHAARITSVVDSQPGISPSRPVQHQECAGQELMSPQSFASSLHEDRGGVIPATPHTEISADDTSNSSGRPASPVDTQPEQEPIKKIMRKLSNLSMTSRKSDRSLDPELAAEHLREELAEISVTFAKSDAQSDVQRITRSKSRTRAPSASMASSRLLAFVTSWPFEIFSALLTCGTVATMSIALNMRVKAWQEDRRDAAYMHVVIAETAFAVLYVIEVAIRFVAMGRSFFRSWLNLLDLALVTSVSIDQIVFWFLEEVFANLAFLRVIRYIRLLKLARVSRVIRRSKDVRVVLHLIRCSLRSMLFTALSLAAIIYMAAFMTMSGVEEILVSHRGDSDNDTVAVLLQHWGSIALSMMSLFMAVTGGIRWKEISDPFMEESIPWLMFFFAYIAFFIFIVVHVINAMTVHHVFEATHNVDQMLINMRMENRPDVIAKLKSIFDNQEVIEFADFLRLKDRSVELSSIVRSELALTMPEMEQFTYRLCACGKQPVDLNTLVTGAIQLRCPARKVDIMDLQKDTQDFIEEAHCRRMVAAAPSQQLTSISLNSLEGKRPLVPQPVARNHLPQHLDEIIQTMRINNQEKERLSKIGAAVFRIAVNASGGCGFVVARKAGFQYLQQRKVDYQVTDRSREFPQGYMSERLKHVKVEDEAFVEAVREFSEHTESDRWDTGPAQGLSKDGYFLIDLNGNVLKAAVRLAGISTPPFRWDGVGTRHLTAMAACWALRDHASVVIVRSDSGTLHTLVHDAGEVKAFKTVSGDGIDVIEERAVLHV